MKILWCFVFYLVFNNFQTIASKLQNENEVTSLLRNLMQRMEALEKLVEMNNKIHKENDGRINKRFEVIEKLVEENKVSDTSSFEQNQQRFGTLEKLHEINIEKVDCGEQCAKDDSCVSVFWSNSSNSECRFNHDKNNLVKFVPGEIYFCKDCQTTLDLVFEAEYSGVIKLTNVATNKMTQASSFDNAMSDPSKAVDGDLNTSFSSEANLTKGRSWLMVDLGQRFLVAQIKIQVSTKPIQEIKGGYFKICLVNDFDRKMNPCNQHSEILKVNRRLRGYSELFDVQKVKMGRYVVVRKTMKDTLEIAELEVLSVIPITSYECNRCLAKSNTVCDESRVPPVCTCAENNLPDDGDARNSCKDPCLDFNEDNAVCAMVDHETRSCSCNAGYHPVNGDACNGCNDPCVGFIGLHTKCSATDVNRYKCSCEQGYIPINYNEPCHGCKRNVCPSKLGYKNQREFGCLKVHKTLKSWEDAQSTCKSEGGDLFSPGEKLPILPFNGMYLGGGYIYWIGVRRRGRNSPYERVASGAKLADHSKLWWSANTEPDRGAAECVAYRSGSSGLLFDDICRLPWFFICEIP